MNSPQGTRRSQKGFTLIEMIGVLAIIAILVAAIGPRIFDTIQDSRITNAVTFVRTLESATTRYFADVGTLQALNNATGAAVNPNNDANARLLADMLSLQQAPVTAGLWSRWRGPYMPDLRLNNPPIGTTMFVEARNGTGPALAAANNTAWDLNGDGASNAAGRQIIALEIRGVPQAQFERVDAILDAGIGDTPAEKQARGRVKWNAANGGTLRILIQSN
jgi:prepilin-type N-terminal cleavage/methylation domain-containing protein